MTILDLLQGDGIIPKKVASTHGGEYASPCPGCGGNDRFRCWPKQGDSGRWWCRQCGKSGDYIEYLKVFRGMSYGDACRHLGMQPKQQPRDNGVSIPIRKKRSGWKPKDESRLPEELYQKKAKVFIEWAARSLWCSIGERALSHLLGRRLTKETIRQARIGYSHRHTQSTTRGAWGITTNRDKRMHLSQGITIPCFAEDGETVVRVRFRLDKPIIKKTAEGKKEDRYILLAGGNTRPMLWDGRHIVTMIVESELCGWLLYQEAGDLVNVVALGNAQKKPDKATDELLRKSELILFALDYDDAGITQLPWWERQYKNLKHWPPAVGKDPTEAMQQGMDLRSWIKTGFPWTEDIVDLFEERAAIMEHDGGLSREEAEKYAFKEALSMELDLKKRQEKVD